MSLNLMKVFLVAFVALLFVNVSFTVAENTEDKTLEWTNYIAQALISNMNDYFIIKNKEAVQKGILEVLDDKIVKEYISLLKDVEMAMKTT